MDRTIEHRGKWWIPELPERVISGVLTLRDEPKLLLDAALVERLPPTPGESVTFGSGAADEQAIIVGEVVGEGPVTLFEAWGGSFGMPSFLVQNETWHAAAALIGSHADAETAFDMIQLSTDYLFDWTGLIGHSTEIGPGRVAVGAEDRDLFSMDQDGHKFSLVSNFTFSNDPQQFVLQNQVFWKIEPRAPMNWRDAINRVVAPLQDLVSFGTMRSNRITVLYLRPSGGEITGEMIVRMRGDESPPRSDRLPAFEQLMPLSVIGLAQLQSVVPNWLVVWRKLRGVISRLLAIDYAPFMYENHRAANVLQAAEGLHKERWNRTSRPPEVHAQVVEDALSGASDAAREWARPLLLGKNSLSLRERLSEIVVKATAAGFPFEVTDSHSYVTAISNLRNVSAHGDLATDDIENRYWKIEGLLWMLRAILLREIGLDQLTVRKLLLNNAKLHHATRRIAWSQRPDEPSTN
jgi:hypothetical protein